LKIHNSKPIRKRRNLFTIWRCVMSQKTLFFGLSRNSVVKLCVPKCWKLFVINLEDLY